MDLRSLMEIEYKGIFFFTIFYLIAGIANFIVLGIHGLALLHVALVAFLSLFSAYGLYRLQSWSLWFVVGLFFVATTYAAFMLNAFLENYSVNPETSILFAIIGYSIYLILTWIGTLYIAAKRKYLR